MWMNRTTSDLMFRGHRLGAFLRRSTFSQPSPNPKCHHLLLQVKPYPSSSPLSLFSTTTTTTDSDKQSFTVSYLTNNCGFSPQAAAKASKRIRFSTVNKPDSFIAFLINHGFSISQIHSIIRRVPELLLCNPAKRVLPKFQFLASKGSDVVTTVARSPFFLLNNLENQTIPAFEFVRRFSPSDQKAIACVLHCSNSVTVDHLKSKVKLLLDMGVPPSNIYLLLTSWPSVLRLPDLDEAVEEVKGLGFDPSKGSFILALLAKRSISKSLWDAKIDAFKTWGCSEDAVLDAFRRDPRLMLFSIKKVNAVMNFWVGHLGWDPSVLLARPKLFGFSLEKRLMPRASVVQYLRSRGLMKKDAGLCKPFMLSEELFLQKFVECFEEEETSKLLSLYQGGH